MGEVLNFPTRNKGRVRRSQSMAAAGELSIVYEMNGPIPDNVVLNPFEKPTPADLGLGPWQRLEAMMQSHMSERFAVMALFMEGSFKRLEGDDQADLLTCLKRMGVKDHNGLALDLYNHWSASRG